MHSTCAARKKKIARTEAAIAKNTAFYLDISNGTPRAIYFLITPEAAFGSFVALIPALLGIGTVTVAVGSVVKGFPCEAHAVRAAEDIASWGGWRAWRNRAPDQKTGT